MDRFLQALVDLLPRLEGPWKYVIAIAALVVVAGPKFAELFRELVDFRLGRRRLEIEKLRLEVLKLKMEVEPPIETPSKTQQFRPEQKTAVVVPPPEPVDRASARERVEPGKEIPGWIRKWVERFPRSGRVFLLILQILFAYMAFGFGAGAVGIPFLAWEEEGLGPAFVIFGALVYGGLAWLSYKGFSRIRAARKAVQPAPREMGSNK
jgi:hypothetical protein